MFRKDKEGSEGKAGEDKLSAPPLKPFSKKGSHSSAKPPAKASFNPEIPRRVVDIPGTPRRSERSRPGDIDSNKLIVGREICLSGEITSCDKLVVEGRVEASLTDARIIEVAPSGFFKGDSHVEEADISGRYEGKMVARDKLTVRSGGQVHGSIRYGRIVIESGGEISGDMQALSEEDLAAGEGEEQNPAKKK